MSSRPPLGLHVEITDADGVRTRWDANAPQAQNIPTGLSFRTQRMTGFADGQVTLSRRIDRDYVDLNVLDDVAFIGHDGTVAYEGRVAGQPRSMRDTHSVTVQSVGWMAHAADRRFTEIYVDRDLSTWRGPSRARRLSFTDLAFSLFEHQVSPDQTNGFPALTTTVVGPWATRAFCEPVYDAGPDGLVGAVYYDFTINGQISTANTSWEWYVGVVSNDDMSTGGAQYTANLRASTGSGYFTATTARRYATIQQGFTAAGGSNGVAHDIYWRKLAVYGAHGLTRRGTDPGGVYASDVIKDVATSYCPRLHTGGVADTTTVIPHLVFKERTTPYDAMLRVNAFHLWELAVWENKTLHYQPVDMADHTWQVRLSDPGVTVDLQGDSADDLVNGIVVEYDDVNKGARHTLTPDTTPALKDTNPDNPVTRHGLTKWTEIQLSSPTTETAATELGRIALTEHNQSKAPGTITVRGHIRDRGGAWQQGWKVRAGDTVAIMDHPNDRPRLVTETSWDHDSLTLSISVEGAPKRLDAVLDRLSTALAAANLS